MPLTNIIHGMQVQDMYLDLNIQITHANITLTIHMPFCAKDKDDYNKNDLIINIYKYFMIC